MRPILRIVSALSVAMVLLSAAVVHGQEIINPKKAAQDPDFHLQGEYVGQGLWPDAQKTEPVGAQVIARGNGRFRAVIYRGGLPGDGWKRGDDKSILIGERSGEKAVFKKGKELPKGELEKGELLIGLADGKPQMRLKRVERKSPALGEKAPNGALVLFDGTSAEKFQGGKLTKMKTLEAGCTLKDKPRMKKLHLEFRLSWKPKARGQGRSNSGVYIGGIPEIQILDSFGLEGRKNECGAFYGKRAPNLNMCFPPLQWQTLDVEFSQPDPKKNVVVTVRHNGVVIHKNYDTGKKNHPPRRLHLQRHGNRVQYRNIWLVKPKS